MSAQCHPAGVFTGTAPEDVMKADWSTQHEMKADWSTQHERR